MPKRSTKRRPSKRQPAKSLRGLPIAGYHRLYRRIKRGDASKGDPPSWAAAEAMGLCLPREVVPLEMPTPRTQNKGRVASAAAKRGRV